jgi:hypothetical protein
VFVFFLFSWFFVHFLSLSTCSWRFGEGKNQEIKDFSSATVVELLLFIALGCFLSTYYGSDLGLLVQFFFSLFYRLDSIQSIITIMPVSDLFLFVTFHCIFIWCSVIFPDFTLLQCHMVLLRHVFNWIRD